MAWLHPSFVHHWTPGGKGCCSLYASCKLANIENISSNSMLSRYTHWQHGTDRICCHHTPAMQQSIDTSCPPGPQQQTCSSGFVVVVVVPCWDRHKERQIDRRTDTIPLHRPCSAYYAGSINKTTSHVSRRCSTATRSSNSSDWSGMKSNSDVYPAEWMSAS